MIREQLLHSLEASAASAAFVLGDSQEAAATHLADLGARIATGRALSFDRRGLYLWGPVGRGKTWLLDRFFDDVPVPSKSRFHFQRFFRDFNAALAGQPVGRASIGASLERLVGGVRLLCFDEFYAHDPGDATLLTRLLEEILARDIPVVITSNYPPSGLLPDAELWTSSGPVEVRQRPFMRGIELIERSFLTLNIDDGKDYRGEVPRRDGERGFRAGRYVVPGTSGQLGSTIGTDVGRQPPEPLRLTGGRRVTPAAVSDRRIVFAFSEICERGVTAGDVLGLASRYTTWTITGVPVLAGTSPEAAQRFVNLVDVLHDSDTCLNIVSRHTLAEIVTGARLPPDIGRAASRLALLRLDHEGGDASTSSRW